MSSVYGNADVMKLHRRKQRNNSKISEALHTLVQPNLQQINEK